MGQGSAQSELVHFQPLAENFLVHLGSGMLTRDYLRIGTDQLQREACCLEFCWRSNIHGFNTFTG